MTIVTIPKSAGVSSRARITTDPICTEKLPADPAMDAPAPRTAVRRSPHARGNRVKGAVGLEGLQLWSSLAMLVHCLLQLGWSSLFEYRSTAPFGHLLFDAGLRDPMDTLRFSGQPALVV